MLGVLVWDAVSLVGLDTRSLVPEASDGVLALGLGESLPPETCVHWTQHVPWVPAEQRHEFT